MQCGIEWIASVYYCWYFTLHWVNGIPAKHFLVQKLIVLSHPHLKWCFVALIDSLITALWWQETKFQYDKQSKAKEWISERWSCASNHHHACEIPFTIRAGLQLNVSARQSLCLCNVVWTERNSLYFFSVDSLCLSQCQTAHPQMPSLTASNILRMNMTWIIPQ